MQGFIFPNEFELQWGLLVVLYPYLTGLVAGAFILASGWSSSCSSRAALLQELQRHDRLQAGSFRHERPGQVHVPLDPSPHDPLDPGDTLPALVEGGGKQRHRPWVGT